MYDDVYEGDEEAVDVEEEDMIHILRNRIMVSG